MKGKPAKSDKRREEDEECRRYHDNAQDVVFKELVEDIEDLSQGVDPRHLAESIQDLIVATLLASEVQMRLNGRSFESISRIGEMAGPKGDEQ